MVELEDGTNSASRASGAGGTTVFDSGVHIFGDACAQKVCIQKVKSHSG